MVMPRSCSCFMKSIVACPPVKYRIRSEQVVFPASMCAAMPIFLSFDILFAI